MNLPRDPKKSARGRNALIAAVTALTAINAAAAAFLVTSIARRPAALAPGDRLCRALAEASGPEPSVLLVLGEETMDDYWAIAAAWEIEERAPGRMAVVFVAPHDTLADAVPRRLETTERTARWLVRRLPVLPSFVFVGTQGLVSAIHPAPIVPGLSSAEAVAFLVGRDAMQDMPNALAADSSSPFLPGIADGERAIELASADPAVLSFLEGQKARARAFSASLRYVDGVGYFWCVEVHTSGCGCTARRRGTTGRVLLRPSDGAILAREFMADAGAPVSRRAVEPNDAPPDSPSDLGGRW